MGCISSKGRRVSVSERRPSDSIPHVKVDLASREGSAVAAVRSTEAMSEEPLTLIRLFISSTFVDFHEEREVLLKQVLPELRSSLLRRGVALSEVDLRWGVPAEASGAATLDTCLGELGRCGQRPFLLAMLGERYGWVPPSADFGEWALKLAPLEGKSMTEMEIRLGALNFEKNPNAVFAFRNSLGQGLPESVRLRWVDENQSNMIKLKNDIRSSYPMQSFEYSPQSAEATGDVENPKIKLKGLDQQFASDVKSRLLKAMTNAIEHSGNAMQSSVEDRCQSLFMREERNKFVGRSEELRILEELADAGTTSLPSLVPEDSSPGDPASMPSFLAVTGPKGVGKSALLASFASSRKVTIVLSPLIPNMSTFPCFFHSSLGSPAGASTASFLRRLAAHCGTQLAEEEPNSRLYATVQELLGTSDGVFVVDGADQMDDETSAIGHLSWVPSQPCKARLIISTADSCLPTLARLQDRRPLHLQLQPLSKTDQGGIIDAYLAGLGKSLDAEQHELLIGSGRSADWLGLALEELRLHGTFRDLGERIRSFPYLIRDLASAVADRIFVDSPDKGLTAQRALCILSVTSPLGLPEWGMPEVVEANGLGWAQTRRALDPLLRTTPDGRLILRSPPVGQMVKSRLLSSLGLRKEFHARVAAFYDRNSAQFEHRHFARRYAEHLAAAGKGKDLLRFIREDKRAFTEKIHLARTYMQDLTCGSLVAVGDAGCGEASQCLRCVPMPGACIFCGTPGSSERVPLCRQHLNVHMGASCLLCGSRLIAAQATAAKACRWCRGIGPPKCAFLG